jgi:hypothetical protein
MDASVWWLALRRDRRDEGVHVAQLGRALTAGEPVSGLAAVINYATAQLGGGRAGAVDVASVKRSRRAP